MTSDEVGKSSLFIHSTILCVVTYLTEAMKVRRRQMKEEETKGDENGKSKIIHCQRLDFTLWNPECRTSEGRYMVHGT